jgi:hypothetical protein
MILTRRLLALVLLLSSLSLAAQTARIRKHVRDLSTEEWRVLDHAFATLKALPEGGPVKSYIEWAQIHGPDGPCEHGSELVWPWHRAYLLLFEDALRASDPPLTSNLTIPYWDWTEKPTGARYPAQFETMHGLFPPDDECPTMEACRETAPHPQPPFSAKTIESLQKLTVWADYGGSMSEKGGLEARPHDTIHGTYIGGLNADVPTAAHDPLFWVHHANLDRLWSEWQAQAVKDGRDPNPVCGTCPINWISPRTASEFFDIAKLGYSYAPKQTPALESLGAAGPGLLSIAFPATPSFVEVPLVIPPLATLERVRLRFDAVTKPTDATYTVRVYLRTRGSAGPRREADLLTFFTMWKSADTHGTHGHAHGAATTDVRLDVTERLRELLAGRDSTKQVVEIAIARVNRGVEATPAVFDEPFGWRRVTIESLTAPQQRVRQQ